MLNPAVLLVRRLASKPDQRVPAPWELADSDQSLSRSILTASGRSCVAAMLPRW